MSEHKLKITLDHETMQRLERYSKRWDLSAPLTGAKLVYVGLQRSDALTDWGDKVRKEKKATAASKPAPKAKARTEKPAPKAKPVAKPKPTKAKAAKVVKPKAEPAKQPKPVAMTLAEAGMVEPARAAEPVLTKAEVAEAMAEAVETPSASAPTKPASKYLDVKVGDKIFDCDPRRQAEKVVTKVMQDHLYIQLPGNQGVVSSVSRESVHTDRTKKKGYALVLA